VTAALLAAPIAMFHGGCSAPLPEAGSPAATLYAARCGSCHQPYLPRTLTAAMWRVQVDRMNAKYRAAGMPAPTPAEHDQILEYLTRNAGG
jgi:hypothetical protein